MKKYCLFLVCLILSSVLLSACNTKPKASMVKAERRLEKYFQTDKSPSGAVVDLSEGPRLQYDRKFGPKDVNFDVKIVNPY